MPIPFITNDPDDSASQYPGPNSRRGKKLTARLLAALLLSSVALFAQAADPGAALGASLTTMFTGPLVLGLSIVGAVVAGCLIMFGGGGAMRGIGSFLLGAILILDAVKLVTYIQSVI